MCRRATLALTTCLGACLGVNRAQLKRLLGAWGFTLSFRRECLSLIDVRFVAAERFFSRKLCKLSGALLDELVLASVLAPLYSANLRSPPLNELFAFDASDSRAGGCRAPVSDEQWRSLFDLSEERGNTCASTGGLSPPTLCSLTRGRQQLGMPCLYRGNPSSRLRPRLPSASTSSRSRAPLSLLRHLAAEGRRNCRVLAITDSRVALGALSKGRSSSRRVNHLLKKAAALCLCHGFQFDAVWVPTWSNTADALSRRQPISAWRNTLSELPPVPPARLLSQRAQNELRQLTEPFPCGPKRLSAPSLSTCVFLFSMPASSRPIDHRSFFSFARASLCAGETELPSAHFRDFRVGF